MNVQPVAWQAELVQAVARVTRVSLTDLLNNTGGNPEERQAIVDLLRSNRTVPARVVETRADGVSVLDLASTRVTIRLANTPPVGETVLLSMEDAPASAQPAPEVHLSRSAMLISDLKKHVLNQIVNQEVSTIPMTKDAASPQVLAQALQKAVRSSGLFYESHLRGWVDGRVPLEDLYAEPQARVAPPEASSPGDAIPSSGEAQRPPEMRNAAESLPSNEIIRGSDEPATDSTLTRGETRHSSEPRPVVHPQLEPLVRQQLDTFEQQRIAWHGVLWPDQQAEIVISGEPESADQQAPRAWRVQLALNTPTLGTVKATLALTGRRLNVQLNGDDAGIDALRKGRAALERALSAHNLDVHPIRVAGGAA